MNATAEKVLSYLAGTANLEAVSVEELQKLAAENPYFSVIHFLLAKKLKAENRTEYSVQVQKTSLYFSNPHWLQYQLSEDKFDEDFLEAEPAVFRKNREDIFAGSTTEDKNEFSPAELSNEGISTNPPATEDTTESINVNSSEVENDAENMGSEVMITPEQSVQPVSAHVAQAEEEMAAITRDTNEESVNFIHEVSINKGAEDKTDSIESEDLLPAAETEVVQLNEEMAGVTHDTGTTTAAFIEEAADQGSANGQAVEADEHDIMFQNIKAMLDASSEEADADTKDAVIPIDPYFTIDYFASQGIKLELDKNPQDQLGQNLKKFTHWLRHMKKLGPEDATEAINRTESEADIQQIADSSNTVREVVTEAMASVLEKQGKKEKAIELYNKLSFLYPNKNAYFADKIKKLKGF